MASNLGCGMKFMKFILFAFNLVIWVLGLVVFIVGIWSRIKSKDFDNLVGTSGSITTAANILICAGIFVAIIGFLGCCGAWKENKVVLVVYAVLLILIFLLEIIAGSLAYKNKGKVQASLKKHLLQLVNHDYDRPDPTSAQKDLTNALDWFQEHVECCGVYGPDDWTTSDWRNRTISPNDTVVALVPVSCCLNKNKMGCNVGSLTDKPSLALKGKIFVEGCVKRGNEYLKDHMWQVGGIAVGIAFIQLLGIVFALLLCRSVGYEEI